jgi:threonine dehydratase
LTTPGAASIYLLSVDSAIEVDRIREAARVIDPVFLHSPQYECEPLSERLGVATVLKVESVNPIRNFKGRGADYLLHRLGDAGKEIVCASAGNFGQAMAYACRKRGVPLSVFASDGANPLKLDRMRALGARVELEPGDFDQAKDAARRHAAESGKLFIEDGLHGPIGEGAGTIALELTERDEPLHAIFVPLGNGSLVNGVGTWLKNVSPKTRVVAVCAEGAPSMALSWNQRKAVEAPARTFADGVSVRTPVPAAVDITLQTVDEVMLVDDDAMRTWMQHLLSDAGLVIEPAGAAGVAAVANASAQWKGKRVATVLTGGNY